MSAGGCQLAQPLPPKPLAMTASSPLRDAAQFFRYIRSITGPLDQQQVDIINAILLAGDMWSLSWMAYGLATAWHEARFKPQAEWGKGKGRPYAQPGRHGQPQYGRGLVQLTWDRNYEWADKALGLNGALLKDFDRALEPKIAVDILVVGMEQGAFAQDSAGRQHSLSRHLTGAVGTKDKFIAARRIINGTDKAELVAGHALLFQSALHEAGYHG